VPLFTSGGLGVGLGLKNLVLFTSFDCQVHISAIVAEENEVM